MAAAVSPAAGGSASRPKRRPPAAAPPMSRDRLAAGLGWLVACAALFRLNNWLWQTRGGAAIELLFWEARRRVLVDVAPPDLAVLLRTDQPLVLYLAAAAGGAAAAAAALGATAALVLFRGWRDSLGAPGTPGTLRRRLDWLLWPLLGALCLLNPAVLVAGAQYPAQTLRALLLLATTACLLRFALRAQTYALLLAALSLGGLAFVDSSPWLLWIYAAAALVLARRRPGDEQLSLVLMLLFPPVVLAAGRLAFAWALGGGAGAGEARRAACAVAGWAQTSGAVEPACVDRSLPDALLQSATSLVSYAPAYLLLAALAVAAALVRTAGRARAAGGPPAPSAGAARSGPLRWPGLVLLLLLPGVELLLRPLTAPEALTATPLDVLFPVLALPLLAGYAAPSRLVEDPGPEAAPPPDPAPRGGAGRWLWWPGPLPLLLTLVLLVSGAFAAWVSLVPPSGPAPAVAGEPGRLLRTARGTPSDPLVPFRQLSALLDGRVQAGQRVLLQGEVLFPLVALLDRGDALLLPSAPEYGLAVQRPAAFATYVVLAPPGPGRDQLAAQDVGWTERLRDYELLTDVRGVRVYVLRGASRPPGSVGVR